MTGTTITALPILEIDGQAITGSLEVSCETPFQYQGNVYLPSSSAYPVTAGVLASFVLPDTTLTTPVNVSYTFTVRFSGYSLEYAGAQPSGSTWDLSSFMATTPVTQSLIYQIQNSVDTALANAAAAQVAAAEAQTAADAAQAVLDSITGTSVLTPGEKSQIVPDYNALVAAKGNNDAQAAAVGISSVAYDTAINNLTAYLLTLTSPVAWNDYSNSTTVNGTTFANYFETAYTEQDNLLNAIAGSISASANLGVENAATALTNAAAALTAAANAQAVLNQITGTSVLTPGEKASIISDYNALIAAQAANDAQADLVGVSRTTYDAALSALTTYLGTLTSPVAWNVTTNYTTINGTTFVSKFQAAYAAQDNLLNTIAGSINTTATTGVTTATSALGGGILQNPNFTAGNVGWSLGPSFAIIAGAGYAGSGYFAKYTGLSNAVCTNLQQIPCSPGAVISASCFIAGSSTAAGTAKVQLVFWTTGGASHTSFIGNAAPANAGWNQSRVVATAPAGTAYATVSGNITATAAYWQFGGFSASVLPNSLTEVPYGSITGPNGVVFDASGNIILKNVALVPSTTVGNLTSTFADLPTMGSGNPGMTFSLKGNPTLIGATADFQATSSGGKVTGIGFTPGSPTAPSGTSGTPSISITINGDGGGASATITGTTTLSGSTLTWTPNPVSINGGSGYSFANAVVTMTIPTGWSYGGLGSGTYGCSISTPTVLPNIVLTVQTTIDGVILSDPTQLITDGNGRAKYHDLRLFNLAAGTYNFSVQGKYDGSTTVGFVDGSFMVIELG